MTTRATIARHRAEVTKTNSLAVIAKAVGENAGGMGRQAAVIAAASGLVLTSGVAANAAETSVQRESASATTLDVQSAVPAVISAASTIAISYEKPAVTTSPAPVVEAPKPVVNVETASDTRTGGTKAGTTATAGAQAPAALGTLGATVAAAAYAQIGVSQDCTALATNALAAAGINYHGWPAGYLSLGRTVSAAQAKPGDLAYYQNGGTGLAHIAVYVGNGMAVHGGWNGGTTALFSVNVGSGPVFISI